MSQTPPYGPAYSDLTAYSPTGGPFAQPPAPSGGSWWKWIIGGIGLMLLMPCLCCSGCLVIAAMNKEVTLANGQHLGGHPFNVKFDYAFANDGSRGPLYTYFIVARAANGTQREQMIHGFGGRIALRGTMNFSNQVDLGPNSQGSPVQVWIEAEDGGGRRSTISNTLTIYPKS